jgi:hypothetical protein
VARSHHPFRRQGKESSHGIHGLPPLNRRAHFAALLLAAVAVVACGTDTTAPGSTVTIHGTVFTVSGDAPPPARVIVRAGGFAQTATVGADGRFTVEAPATDSFEMRVEQPSGAALDFLPTLRRFAPGVPDGWQARVLLVPAKWTIHGGEYAGRTVDVSLDRIYDPDDMLTTRLPLWPYDPWPSALLQDEGGPPVSLSSVTWPDSIYPIPLYIERDSADAYGVVLPVDAADSAFLWTEIDDLESKVGMDLFRPVRKADLPVDTVEIPNKDRPIVRPFSARFSLYQDGTNGGGATWACYGDQAPLSDSCRRFGGAAYISGSVTVVKLQDDLTWRSVLQHELFHVLGLGHSCFEPSIMTYCNNINDWLPGTYGTFENGDVISDYDVAYFRLLLAVHRRSVEVRPHLGLLEALQGERELLLGKPPLWPHWWQP